MTIEPRNIQALVIGIGNYRYLNPLGMCGNDAVDFSKLLVRTCGCPRSQVSLLLDDKATKRSIDDGLESLTRRAKPDDTAIFFFSGHGLQRLGGFAQGEYLCAVETDLDHLSSTAISSEEMGAALRALNANRVVIFLDACHSGGVGGPKGATFEVKAGLSQQSYDRLVQEEGRVIFSSCKSDEVSWELAGMRNGLFTHYLLDGLRGAATSEDGRVYISTLFGYVSRQVQAHAKRAQRLQTPWFKGEFQDFALTGVPQSDRPGEPYFEDLEKKEIKSKMDKDRVYVAMVELLESRFQETDLRRAAFVVLGPGSYENLAGRTFTERVISLIETLKTREKIDAFIGYIGENRPDIDLFELGLG
jgi:hypothetical protein